MSIPVGFKTRATRWLACLVWAVFGAAPALAQQTAQECLATSQSCQRNCQLLGLLGAKAVQSCGKDCVDKQKACRDSAAQAGARPGLPGLPMPTAPAPRPQPAPVEQLAAPAGLPTATPYVAPADLAYEGPSRFFPPFAKTDTPDDAKAPLENERPDRLRNTLLESPYSTPVRNRTPAQKALGVEILKEYDTLEAAGYAGLICAYGPFPTGGYSSVSFWAGKRAKLSPQLLDLVKIYTGLDAAVVRCPRTWGEALAIGTDKIKAASAADVAATSNAVMKRTGQRYIPSATGAGEFSDDRQLNTTLQLTALNLLMDQNLQQSPDVLGKMQPGLMRDTLQALHDAKQKVLLCRYVHEGMWTGDSSDMSATSPASGGVTASAKFTDLKFWLDTRPKSVSAEFLKSIDNVHMSNNRPLYDLPLPKCPASYGEAMALIDGSPEALAIATQAAAGNNGMANRIRNTDAEDRAFKADIERQIAELESGFNSLTPDAWRRVVTGSLKTSLNRLAGSSMARLQDIPLANRKRFDDWDRDYGGTVITAVRQLDVLGRKKAFRIETQGASMSDLLTNRDQAEREKLGWINAVRAGLYTRPIYEGMTRAYDLHLAGQPLIDAKFLERARKGLGLAAAKAQAQQAQAEAGTRTVTTTRTVVLFGTPGEIAAARVGMQIGDGIAGAVSSAAQIQNLHAALNARIVESRQAFWACLASNCAEASDRYLAYSIALRDKDYTYLFQPVVYKKIDQIGSGSNQPPIIGTLIKYLGGGSVDDGIVTGCEREAENVKSAFEGSLKSPGGGLDVSGMMNNFAKASQSREYQTFQDCRDRKEYIYRPR